MNILNILKLWPVPCLVFCLYCLYTLVGDSYEVLYMKRTGTEPLQFLACEILSRVFPDKREIDLKELQSQLYDLFTLSEKYSYEREDFPDEFELILNRTKSGDYLVFNRKICFFANDRRELKDFFRFLSYETVQFAIKSDTFDFVQMGSRYDQIDQLIVRKKGRPYSDCDESNGRFFCLNECFRRHFRLAHYLYHGNETGHILLDYSENNRTIQESEKICFSQCRRENCKLVQLTLVNESKEPQTFDAQPVLSALDFFVELFGRVFLFVNLFFDQLASIATKLSKKFARSRVRRKKVKIVLFYLNLAIIFFNLAYSGYQCVRLVRDYNEETIDQPEREMRRNLIQPKTVRLAICVYKYVKGFYGKTMSEIERATEGALDDVLKDIYVSNGGRSFRTDYRIHHRKILFKKLSSGYSARCFPMSIHSNFQTISSRPKLTIRLKKDVSYELYVLSEEEDLNSKSFEYTGGFAFQKRIMKRLKLRGNCVNYEGMNRICTGRQNCIDRCSNKKFMERYNKTAFGAYSPYPAIDRDWFSSSEWNTTRMMEIKFADQSIYTEVRRECEKKVSDEKPCDEVKFEATVEIKETNSQIKEIDLQFDVVQSIKESPSSIEMSLDLLSIQSIFFGFTLLKLFWLVYRFIKPRWRLRNDKIIWFVICLLCSLGCSWNTIRIDDVIVNGELVPTEYYERAKRIPMPAMVFCFRINQKLVDRNHPLTGSHLDELTKKMNAKSTFKNIMYLKESNEWTPFNLRRVEHFFFLDMKCFKLDINQDYNRSQFHFSDHTQVLKANFKKAKENRFVYFMTQSKETAEFSKISNLEYSKIYGYSITHEASLYEHKDRYDFFRRHFRSLEEGDVSDLHGQLLELQANEANLKTLSLPVEEEHFGLEIDEDRFEQLHSVQKKSQNKRTNLNYRQIFVANHFKASGNSKSDFSFHLIFLRRVVHLTNEVSYATLTLSVLNLLSIWLELGVLDLRPFLVYFHDYLLVYLYLRLPVLLLRKLIKALFFCCRWLRKFEPILYERIDSQWKEEEEEDTSEDSSEIDESSDSSAVYSFRLIFLCRLFLKLFNLM